MTELPSLGSHVVRHYEISGSNRISDQDHDRSTQLSKETFNKHNAKQPMMSTIRRAYMEISNGIRGLRLHREQPNADLDYSASPGSTSSSASSSSTTSPSSPSMPAMPSLKSSTVTSREGSITSQMQSTANATAAAIRKTIQRGAEGSNAALATRFVRSPKAGIVRRIRKLNQSINGHKQRACAENITELMLDDDFLATFFLYLPPTERGNLCQVCRKWRKILYRPHYWVDVRPIISFRDWTTDSALRRHLYDSFQLRGFDSICLFGATDADVQEFVNSFQTSKTHLRSLSIRCSNVTDSGLETLFRKMPFIYRLELSSCNEITETGFWSCLNSKIVSLSIMDCINVADDTLGAIAQLLPSLYELSLQAYHVTDAALALFSPKQSYTLSILRLTSCWEVTNNGLVNIVNALPNLTVLGLSGCSKISDDGVELIAENLRRLRVLDLSWCPRISDASLEYIACDLSQLEELVLDRCTLVTDMGIGYVSTMGSLQKLYLRYCQQVRDLALHHLYSMRKLRHLSLAGCNQISQNALCGLNRLPNLVELEVTNCQCATPGVIAFLRDNMPYCQVIL